MKKLLLFTITCCLFNSLYAQTIEGTVYDASTEETIPGVVIYLDGTTIHTISDADGKFRLVLQKQMNTNLIFNHISYEPLIVNPPFDNLGNIFSLKEKTNMLTEVRILADRFSATEKMRVFKEEFLGRSSAGKSCVILNENDIVLNYDDNTNELLGHSIKPLIIENRYLGYRVTFDLRDFRIQYSENTINMAKARKVIYKGTSSFTDLSPYNILLINRREEIYRRSSVYFWKNFVSGTLDETEFKIYNRSRKIQWNQYFAVVDAMPYKRVLIIPETNIDRFSKTVPGGSIHGVIEIRNGGRFRSEAVFLTNRFGVDEFGLIDNIDSILYLGDMGGQRLGEMLPMDFVLTSPPDLN